MTTKNSTLTRTRLLELLDYEGISGKFTWKERPLSDFNTERECNSWGGQYSGKEAGSVGTHGYRHIGIAGKIYKAHRLAILHFYGEFPEDEVDHVDHNKDNNGIWNLRCVTRSGNMRNMVMPKTNTSGCMGVFWRRDRQQWRVQIRADGRKKHLGYFTSFQKAKAVRLAAEVAFGYFEGHGRARK